MAFLSAFIGAYSHVAIDSIVHSDMEPLFPLSEANQLLNLVSVEMLHKLCVYSAIGGGVLYYAISWLTSLHKRGKVIESTKAIHR